MTEILNFLTTRRSHPPKMLTAPGPARDDLARLLQAATRVPDHGKLEPWRLLVLGPQTRADLAERARAHSSGMDPTLAEKGIAQFSSPCLVAVIAAPRPSERIPEIEQTLSAGAVCLSLVNAALATGWGASWLTGWVTHDRAFAVPAYGLSGSEWVAGLIHIGTPTRQPTERPRPDMESITSWYP